MPALVTSIDAAKMTALIIFIVSILVTERLIWPGNPERSIACAG